MNTPTKRCAIYTRKSSEEGLEQEFNSLHAQRESCAAYIISQKHEGWDLIPDAYDDGGFSGGNMQRPALKQLMEDIEVGKVDIIVVYKVDRLTRSLADFAKLVELMDTKGISFVSITQQFNTTTSMGRLTLNVLLSFAQFEREVTGERIRDKIAMSKQKGKWMGGLPPMGYKAVKQKLIIHEDEAKVIQYIFERYLALCSVNLLKAELDRHGYVTKQRTYKTGKITGGKSFSKGHLYRILQNRIYIGDIVHKDKHYEGEHEAIIESVMFEQVQKTLNESRISRSNAIGAKSPCLLAGKIFDDAGNSMTPKHSLTRKRHYRYYTSQAIIQSRHHEAGSLPNIPAGEIEKLVKTELRNLLQDSEKLQPLLTGESLNEQARLFTLANALTWIDAEEERIFLRSFISKIIISDSQIEISLCPNSLLKSLKALAADNPIQHQVETNIENPIQLTRKAKLAATNNGSKVIAGQIASGCNMQLVKSVTRSFLWHEQIVNGEVSSLNEIRERDKVTSNSYFTNVMRLRFLAPDIIETILNGTHPTEWTIGKIFKVETSNWHEQRQQLNLI
ncbi:MAG: recombinase family protein [Rickettsiales bacterium]|nr:recombinase family protein [Rickettsiales bacterium]